VGKALYMRPSIEPRPTILSGLWLPHIGEYPSSCPFGIIQICLVPRLFIQLCEEIADAGSSMGK